MVGLHDGEKILRMCITVYSLHSIPACDGGISCDGIVCTMHTRRAVTRQSIKLSATTLLFRCHFNDAVMRFDVVMVTDCSRWGV